MNTVDFIFGQLLTLEAMTPNRERHRRQPTHSTREERIVDNQWLLILFLFVSLIANYTVMATPDQ